MPNLYAIQFDVVPRPSGDAQLEFEEIRHRIGNWIVAGYSRKWNTSCQFPQAGEMICPLPDHAVQVSASQVGEYKMERTRWVHPDGVDPHLRWATDIVLARNGERIQFGMQVGVTSTSFMVQPVAINLGRPRLISEMLSFHSSWIGRRPILIKKLQIQAQDVKDFVHEDLLDTSRSLPIVVVSHDRFTDCPALDSDRLQTTLLGFAQVAVLDKWATFQLTDELSKALSCFNGCIRIYWPGLKLDSNPLDHWLYFPSNIERFEIQNKPLDRRLFAFLSRLSAARYVDPSMVREIQSKLEFERTLESARIQKQIQDGRTAASTLQDVQGLLDLAIKENAELTLRVANLQMDNDALASQLRDVQQNFNVFQQHQALEPEEPLAAERRTDVEYESVLHALAEAEKDFGPELLVLDDARRSAGTSEFARPEEVYRALMAIREVGVLHLESARTGTSMGSWAEQLKIRGFTQFSANESATVKNDYKKYGRYREFVVNGTKRQIFQHLDLGGGDRTNCLQIYFEVDRDIQRTIIAYCGVHLPFPRQRT